MTVRFHPDAEGDFREAILWYDQQRVGLGAEFMLCVDEAVERIRRSPEMHPKVYREIRRAVVRRFPFAVFFAIVGTDIRVLAVFHSRRSPRRWKSRQ